MIKMKMTLLKKITLTVLIALGSLFFVYAVTVDSKLELSKNFPMQINFAGEEVPTSCDERTLGRWPGYRRSVGLRLRGD